VAVAVGFRGDVIDCDGRLLARDETEKDALDRVELDGVDERVGADVEEAGEHDRVVAALKNGRRRTLCFDPTYLRQPISTPVALRAALHCRIYRGSVKTPLTPRSRKTCFDLTYFEAVHFLFKQSYPDII